MYLEYQLTEEEYKDFSYYTGWSSPEKKQVRIKYYVINLIVYFGLLILVFSLSPKPIHASTIVIIVIVVILLIIYLWFGMKNRFKRSVEKVIKESGEERILSLLQLNITESGITGKTGSAETNYQWTAIFKKIEVNNCCYLYLDSRQAIIIPTRIFNSIQEKEEFDKLLSKYIPLSADFPSIEQ